eukprot:6267196-Pyramimonas_sp.AAC.1
MVELQATVVLAASHRHELSPARGLDGAIEDPVTCGAMEKAVATLHDCICGYNWALHVGHLRARLDGFSTSEQ